MGMVHADERFGRTPVSNKGAIGCHAKASEWNGGVLYPTYLENGMVEFLPDVLGKFGCAEEMDVREKEIKAMEKDKEVRSKLEKFEGRATEALMRVGCDYVKLKGTELVDILRWHQIPSNEIGGVAANYKKWLELCGEDPPTYLKWSDIDEAQLAELRKREIDISDTALGRHQDMKRRELEGSVHLYSEEQLLALETKITEARNNTVDNILAI
jgi:hypothetical protein